MGNRLTDAKLRASLVAVRCAPPRFWDTDCMADEPFNPLRRAIVRNVRAVFNDTASGERPVPPSDEALFVRDTPIRMVHADVTAMMVGGVSALLLQMLHPHALRGVLDHSTFRTDLHGRLRRTARFIAVTTYGHRDEAEHAIARVNSIHRSVTGTLPDGTPYSATEPSVLAWVHLAEATSFLDAHLRYVRPAMPQAERDHYFAQFAEIARRLHADPVPTSESEARVLMRDMRSDLQGSADARTVAAEILSPVGQRGASRALQPLLARAAVDLLPRFAVSMLGLRKPALSAVPVRAGTAAIGHTLRWAFGSQRRE